MGSSNGGENEKPEHKVYLDAFWIDQTEVTNAMFRRFVEATGYRTDAKENGGELIYIAQVLGLIAQTPVHVYDVDWEHPQGTGSNLKGLDNYPVVQVNWDDANAYCRWAGRNLPTEAQWEKAARGTDGRIYPWGDEAPDLSRSGTSEVSMAEVGKYPKEASPYGAFDIVGNVHEWVADWYDDKYYFSSPTRNPLGPVSGSSHVLRGGRFGYKLSIVNASYRNNLNTRNNYTGFRCALSVQ